MTWLGIDLGTSGVKALLVDGEQRVLDTATSPLHVSRPRPLWSEQDPEDWWAATGDAVAALRSRQPIAFAAVRGIGLAGQMHGATLLDERDRVLRPAILWNDGRCGEQCRELERREPRSREITGNLAMPGFTAPKLLWVADTEPEIFRAVRRVLLPKDWLRLRLTGEYVSEPSDAAGTLWLDLARRDWSPTMLEATGLGTDAMPRLVEGSEIGGRLRAAVAREWGLAPELPIAGGAGDNAGGAVGVGVIRPGEAFLSLGTSGVYFVPIDTLATNPERGVHTFCHCLPATWHQMSVILSAASCLSWLTALLGAADENALLAEADDAPTDAQAPLFLPYLSGERTPHNDPHAKGVFFGLTHATRRGDLARAVLEGVAFALADGQDALLEIGTKIEQVALIGGGARSALWAEILASVLGRPLTRSAGAEVGPAFGAARLARLAATGEEPQHVCTAPPVERLIEPDPSLLDLCRERHARFRQLYADLRDRFTPEVASDA